MTSVLVAGLAFVLSYLLTRWLIRPDSVLSRLDYPSERSLHEQPTPRGGGLAIALGVLTAVSGILLLHGGSDELAWLALAALVILAISFVDDRSHVHPGIRIAVHFVVAALLIRGGLGLDHLDLPGLRVPFPGVVGVPLTALYVVWMVNLYNFMDGMDGFAGGMALIGFASFAVLAGFAGHYPIMMIGVGTAAAAGGFLIFNFPPARIFMGDVGSSLLGLLAAGLSLWAEKDDVFAIWVGVLIFSPFIVDATVTLVRRLVRGERVWEAHKSHFYQRLVQLGWGHRQTVTREYALMLACAVSALATPMLSAAQRWALLSAWIVVYTTLVLGVRHIESHRNVS